VRKGRGSMSALRAPRVERAPQRFRRRETRFLRTRAAPESRFVTASLERQLGSWIRRSVLRGAASRSPRAEILLYHRVVGLPLGFRNQRFEESRRAGIVLDHRVVGGPMGSWFVGSAFREAHQTIAFSLFHFLSKVRQTIHFQNSAPERPMNLMNCFCLAQIARGEI
jgi:hypothetical protein